MSVGHRVQLNALRLPARSCWAASAVRAEFAQVQFGSERPMTATDPATTKDLEQRLIPRAVTFIVLATVLAAFGFVCYSVGSHRGAEPPVLTGRAYVSPDQGGVSVNGWTYGFGWSPAYGQHESWRVVTWIQCIQRPSWCPSPKNCRATRPAGCHRRLQDRARPCR